MYKINALLVAGLLLAAPAAAQNASGGLSAAGTAIVQEHKKKRAADLAPLVAKKREIETRFNALLAPEAYDEAKLAATFKELGRIEGQIFDAVGSTTLSLLKALSPEDRKVYMTSIGKAPPAAAAAAPKVKPGPGR